MKSDKDTDREKMAKLFHYRYPPPNQQQRRNHSIVANIVELASTQLGKRGKIIHKLIISKALQACERLSYNLEIMIVKGLLDMD
ncbi:MAG: hypothetical protein M3247_05965 [Thermoproteota archaeon]|nr:hypothetical protein [Thermoproteota archaeon]